MARWGLAIAVTAGVFAGAWWVCQEWVRLDESAALGVAGAMLALVLAVAGWWASRERPGDDGVAVAPLLPTNDLDQRIDKLKQMVSLMSPRDLSLHFVSHIWGFEVDLVVPSQALVRTLTYTLVQGLELSPRIVIPDLADDYDIQWSLKNEKGRQLNPRKTLSGVGLKPGATVQLHATLQESHFDYLM